MSETLSLDLIDRFVLSWAEGILLLQQAFARIDTRAPLNAAILVE